MLIYNRYKQGKQATKEKAQWKNGYYDHYYNNHKFELEAFLKLSLFLADDPAANS